MLLDWYVDSINGNNANTGKSPAEAFQTITTLEAAGISASDSIGLALGSHWREQLDITVDNVFIGTYGSGASPILDASNVAPNASFSKTAGQVNVYEIDITPEWAGGGKNFVNVWEDDAYLTRVANVADCDATPGSCYPSAEGAGTVTLYVHASDSSDVTSNGKTYEYSHRQHGLSCSGQNCTVIGLTTQRNLHNNGSASFGKFSTVRDCQFLDGGVHNALFHTGSQVFNCVARNAYAGATSATLFVFNENTPAGEGVLFDNCQAIMDTLGGGITGFLGHNNVSGSFGTVTLRDCTAQRCNVGYSLGANQDSIVFQRNAANNCTVGLRAYMGHTIQDYSVTMQANGTRGIEVNTTEAVTLDGYLCCLNKAGVNGVFSGAAANVTMQNSVFAGMAGTLAVYLTHANAALVSNDNRFGDGPAKYRFDGTANPDYTGDNNCYETDTGGFRNSAGWMNLAAWKILTGQDANSTVGGCDVSAAPC